MAVQKENKPQLYGLSVDDIGGQALQQGSRSKCVKGNEERGRLLFIGGGLSGSVANRIVSLLRTRRTEREETRALAAGQGQG